MFLVLYIEGLISYAVSPYSRSGLISYLNEKHLYDVIRLLWQW